MIVAFSIFTILLLSICLGSALYFHASQAKEWAAERWTLTNMALARNAGEQRMLLTPYEKKTFDFEREFDPDAQVPFGL